MPLSIVKYESYNMIHVSFSMCFWYEFNLQNTITVLGKNFLSSGIYLRGRIHLTDITENYKKYQNLSLDENTNGDESNTTNDPSSVKEFKTYDPNDYQISISGDGSITWCYRYQNYWSAIAAVDYAMRETKPSCGLVKEFKIISK